MPNVVELLSQLPPLLRILAIAGLALIAHMSVRLLQRLGQWIMTPRGEGRDAFQYRFPKLATVLTILVSALTFTIYFLAFGLVMKEAGISLKAYLASASVIGLAIGFGSQGLVQDVVIGLTLIFSDVLNVNDMVDISGQSGRVDRIGLRFTTLVNLMEQRVFIPNRSIAQINRYRNGYIRAYVDVQLPEDSDHEAIVDVVTPIAQGMHAQYSAVVLTEPEIMGVLKAEPGGWYFLRIKFRLWPGQGPLIEGPFKQRTLAKLKQLNAEYADWMITVTYRAE